MLFANPWCGHTLEELRSDKCTSGSGFIKEHLSSRSRWQREKLCCTVWPQGAANEGAGWQPLDQLSLTTSEETAPNRKLTQHSLPSDLFCAFSTNRFLFSAAKIIYSFPLFSLAEFSSTPPPPFLDRLSITQLASHQHLAALPSFLSPESWFFLPSQVERGSQAQRHHPVRVKLNGDGTLPHVCFFVELSSVSPLHG